MSTTDKEIAETVTKHVGETADAIRAGQVDIALAKLQHLACFALRVNESATKFFEESRKLLEASKARRIQHIRNSVTNPN